MRLIPLNKDAFLDIRSHGFLRVAVVVPLVHLADPMENAREHMQELRKVYEMGAQLAVGPELGLTGYSNGDLFFSEVLLDAAEDALEYILEKTEYWDWDMLIQIGMPVRCDGVIFNCAVTILRGRILAVTPKSYLPNYGEFYEKRHFADTSHLISTEVELCGLHAPIGADLLIKSLAHPHFVLGTDVCEDIWVPVPPSRIASMYGATVLTNLSASNITIGKSDYRTKLVEGNSGAGIAVQLYSAAGFGESTADLAWDGEALIAERGVVVGQGERFSLEGMHLVRDVNLKAIAADRKRITSWRDCRHNYPKSFRTIQFEETLGCHGANYQQLLMDIDPHPFVPSDPTKRNERCRETFLIQATSLARRLLYIKNQTGKAPNIVVGGSGGQDSTHAINVALHALDLLNKRFPGEWPRTKLIIITMPGFGTTSRTKSNALKQAEASGATVKEAPVIDLARLLFSIVDHDENIEDLTFENTQAWGRMFIELVHAAKHGALVLGTGDLSELLIGWCTMFGDHVSHYNVNGGVPKTLISYLIKWTADVIFVNEEDVRTVLYDVLDTPISPELLRPDAEGRIQQKTEAKMGPYELHDFFGYYLVRFGFAPSTILRLASEVFIGRPMPHKDGVYDYIEIRKWLRVFIRRFFSNQYKRDVFMNGPKVGLVALSPRGDWRMPSDAEVTAWIADLDRTPETLST